jgi:urea transport system ATP-binding protein
MSGEPGQDAAGRELLSVEHLTIRFGGLVAVDDVSFTAGDRQITAIIGPNGAGKTTMMDVITGKTRPDTGEVVFDDVHDLTQLDETEIAELGIGRKFQKPTVFESHTVADNVRLALAGERTTLSALFGSRDRITDSEIDTVLERARLKGDRDRLAGDLSHGQKQWLEIAMLLAQDPKLLLVDEPVAGMTDAETEDTASLLRDIATSHSVVVVEHDMAFVRDLGVKVTCLHEGSVLSEGTIDAVSADERVIEVYLGR